MQRNHRRLARTRRAAYDHALTEIDAKVDVLERLELTENFETFFSSMMEALELSLWLMTTTPPPDPDGRPLLTRCRGAASPEEETEGCECM